MDDFVEQSVQLFQNATLWQNASQQAVQQGTSQYCQTETGELLIQRINDLLANLQAQRTSYFTGLMLNHHHHKSTQYMGQWIEAKNRIKS